MSTRYPNDATTRPGREPGPDPGCVYRTVEIPGADSHDGTFSIEVSLRWTCPRCTGPRGLPFRGISFDGSHRLAVDRWQNPCGHVDFYSAVRREARGTGLEWQISEPSPTQTGSRT